MLGRLDFAQKNSPCPVPQDVANPRNKKSSPLIMPNYRRQFDPLAAAELETLRSSIVGLFEQRFTLSDVRPDHPALDGLDRAIAQTLWQIKELSKETF